MQKSQSKVFILSYILIQLIYNIYNSDIRSILETDHDIYGHPMARRQPVNVQSRSLLAVNDFQAIVDNAAGLSISCLEDPAGPLSAKVNRRKSRGNTALAKRLRIIH